MKSLTFVLIISMFLGSVNCSKPGEEKGGKLYIIGGGAKSNAMMDEIVSISGIRQAGYMFILPMASSVPDSSLIWAREDFSTTGITPMPGYAFRKGEIPPADKLDSLRSARLIFICGGDQSRFMDVVKDTPVMDAIREAFRNGAVIAGTSAGAAVMSRTMITGNQKKHPDEDFGFITIEENNIETSAGLGLLDNVIIDQHFIKRQRLNRLVTVSIEHPSQLCVGIDESTAIVVNGDEALVTGRGQVMVIRNRKGLYKASDGLLGTDGLELSVFLPGQRFSLLI